MTPIRDAKNTRQALLRAAFEESYRHGFQAASVSRILKNTKLTKGALFHYFPTKKALGYAVVDEVIAGMIRRQWVDPLASSNDPVHTILEEFEKAIALLASQRLILGCPLNNLAQEMSPIDAGFRKRTQTVFRMWITTFAAALEKGKAMGKIRPSVNTAEAGLHLVSQIEGILSLSKNAQDSRILYSGLRSVGKFLKTLQP